MNVGPKSFREVLTEAINELTATGFVSQERVNEWVARLREAIERDTEPDWRIDQETREKFERLFHRHVDGLRLPAVVPGVGRFTKEMVKPKLWGELDRRILAAASLIKLHKQEATERTLQRFAGWSTSIPPGGDRTIDRVETKGLIGKDLRNYRYHRRLVDNDQGHKLVANVSALVAQEAGAIAAKWNSHGAHDASYNARRDHLARDGKLYLIRDSWAHAQGLVKPVNGYTDDITAPGREVNCFPGDTLIPFADGVEVAYRRWFSGELTSIVTISGKTLRGTFNHPILTTNGWVAIGALNEGDCVIEIADKCISVVAGETDDNQTVPSISEIFSSLTESGISESCAGFAEQFHGDGSYSDVDIVYATGHLTFGRKSGNAKCIDKFDFAKTYHTHFGSGARLFCSQIILLSAPSFMRIYSTLFMLFRSFVFRDQFVSSSSVSYSATHCFDVAGDSEPTDVKALRQIKDAFAGIVQGSKQLCIKMYVRLARKFWPHTDDFFSSLNTANRDAQSFSDLIDRFPLQTQSSRVIKINREPFSGHVYNLQTSEGWYIAQGIVSSNCRCWYTFILSPRDLPDAMLTRKGQEWIAAGREELRRRMAG